jgi:hypothetical protein
MNDQKASFLPFHALSEFMRDDYRLEIVRTTLSALPGLPPEFNAPIERWTKKVVQVPGFRNSAKAPSALRVRPTAEAFGKSHDLAAAILSAWAALHPDLRQRVFDLLSSRNWELLPVDTDRSKLPGFFTRWPKGEDFEVLNDAYTTAYPDLHDSTDDVSLMTVWVSARLPYELEEDDEPEDELEDELEDKSGADKTSA